MSVVGQVFNYNLRTEEAEAGDVWSLRPVCIKETAKKFSRQGFSVTHFLFLMEYSLQLLVGKTIRVLQGLS